RMRQSRSRGRAVSGAASDEKSEQRLRGPWIMVARMTWLLFITSTLTVPYARALPSYFDAYLRACENGCALSLGGASALTRFGIPLHAYAWLAVGLTVALLLSTSVMGFILIWRAPHLIALLTGAFVLTVPRLVGAAADNSIHTIDILPTWLTGPLGFVAIPMIFIFLFAMFALFPSGRFVPHWSWALLVPAALLIFLATAGDEFTWLFPLVLLGL